MSENFLVSEGEEAKRQAEQPTDNGNYKKNTYVKLKAGESIRVILLDDKFPNYYGHGDYNARILSHLCTAPRAGMPCKSCDLGIKRSMKYLIPFYDVDKKEIVLWDTNQTHVKSVYAIIDTYGEDVTGEVFLLKRTGSGAKDTVYSFIPLPPKQKAGIALPEDVQPFEFGSQERSDFYASILRAPSEDYLNKLLGGTQAAPVEGQENDHNF